MAQQKLPKWPTNKDQQDRKDRAQRDRAALRDLKTRNRRFA